MTKRRRDIRPGTILLPDVNADPNVLPPSAAITAPPEPDSDYRTNLSEIEEPVTVLVNPELVEKLRSGWSAPVQLKLVETSASSTGYELIARTPSLD